MKKLNEQQKEIILNFGYEVKDLQQIEAALNCTEFELSIDGKEDEKTTIENAMMILGEIKFLSGICRSAFHYTSVRSNKKGESIYFDSSKLFK